MIEKEANPEGKDQVAVEGVLDAAGADGTGFEVGRHEQQAAQETEHDGDDVAEEQGVDDDQGARLRPLSEAVDEEGPEDDLLGQNRKERIEQYDQELDFGTFQHEGEEEFGVDEPDEKD